MDSTDRNPGDNSPEYHFMFREVACVHSVPFLVHLALSNHFGAEPVAVVRYERV